MTAKTLFCLIFIFLATTAAEQVNEVSTQKKDSNMHSNQTQIATVTQEVPSNNKPMSIKGPTIDNFEQKIDTNPENTMLITDEKTDNKNHTNDTAEKNPTTSKIANVSETQQKIQTNEEINEQKTFPMQEKQAPKKQLKEETQKDSVDKLQNEKPVNTIDDMKNQEKLKTQAIEEKKQRNNLSQSKQRLPKDTTVNKQQKSLTEKLINQTESKQSALVAQAIEKSDKQGKQIKDPNKVVNHTFATTVNSIAKDGLNIQKEAPKVEPTQIKQQTASNKTIVSFNEEVSEKSEQAEDNQAKYLSKQIKIIPLIDQSQDESEEDKQTIKDTEAQKTSISQNSKTKEQNPASFDQKEKKQQVAKEQKKDQKEKSQPKTEKDAGSKNEVKEKLSVEKQELLKQKTTVSPSPSIQQQKDLTQDKNSKTTKQKDISQVSKEKSKIQDKASLPNLTQENPKKQQKKQLKEIKNVETNHNKTQQDKKQEQIQAYVANQKLPVQDKHQINDNLKNKSKQQTQTVVKQDKHIEATKVQKKQTSDPAQIRPANKPEDISQNVSIKKEEEKEDNLKELLQQIKKFDLNQNAKIKVIKHLQKDIKLSQQKQKSATSNPQTVQQPSQQHLKQQQTQTQLESKAQHVMDTQTVTVIIVLTFLISIPIVREIKSKANSTKEPIRQQPNDTASVAEEANQRLDIQFSDLDNQTRFGIDEPIEQQQR